MVKIWTANNTEGYFVGEMLMEFVPWSQEAALSTLNVKTEIPRRLHAPNIMTLRQEVACLTIPAAQKQ